MIKILYKISLIISISTWSLIAMAQSASIYKENPFQPLFDAHLDDMVYGMSNETEARSELLEMQRPDTIAYLKKQTAMEYARNIAFNIIFNSTQSFFAQMIDEREAKLRPSVSLYMAHLKYSGIDTNLYNKLMISLFYHLYMSPDDYIAGLKESNLRSALKTILSASQISRSKENISYDITGLSDAEIIREATESTCRDYDCDTSAFTVSVRRGILYTKTTIQGTENQSKSSVRIGCITKWRMNIEFSMHLGQRMNQYLLSIGESIDKNSMEGEIFNQLSLHGKICAMQIFINELDQKIQSFSDVALEYLSDPSNAFIKTPYDDLCDQQERIIKNMTQTQQAYTI